MKKKRDTRWLIVLVAMYAVEFLLIFSLEGLVDRNYISLELSEKIGLFGTAFIVIAGALVLSSILRKSKNKFLSVLGISLPMGGILVLIILIILALSGGLGI